MPRPLVSHAELRGVHLTVVMISGENERGGSKKRLEEEAFLKRRRRGENVAGDVKIQRQTRFTGSGERVGPRLGESRFLTRG